MGVHMIDQYQHAVSSEGCRWEYQLDSSQARLVFEVSTGYASISAITKSGRSR